MEEILLMLLFFPFETIFKISQSFLSWQFNETNKFAFGSKQASSNEIIVLPFAIYENSIFLHVRRVSAQTGRLTTDRQRLKKKLLDIVNMTHSL